MIQEPIFDPTPIVSEQLALPRQAVAAVAAMLKEGATVPFIARYRKEATGGLDELQIRNIEERVAYVVELDTRRKAIATEIESQGKLTDELKKKIAACSTKAELEDLYLPFKPKRRTRAMIAKERGLEPLADRMASQPDQGDPADEARAFVDPHKEVADIDAALTGARDICAERIAESADVRKLVRETLMQKGAIRVGKKKDQEDKATKFDMYASYDEALATIPSHRFLAIRRGEAEGVLHVGLEMDQEPVLAAMQRFAGVRSSSQWAGQLVLAVADAYKRLLVPSAQLDARVELKLKSDRAAVDVFAQNLRELLLAAPYGTKAVLGIDPGQRTGCKCAVVDSTGKMLAHEVLYLVQGDDAIARSKRTLRDLCARFPIAAIAVGNGTHGRETEQFVKDVLAEQGKKDLFCVSVSEAGASVYSASDIAREEFPDLDLTIRGAISIARRLQDPLAELVKIDPKSIGVGQYQHDVFQPLLAKKLDEVVESCVNKVGVELNTASAPLLSRVAGIGPGLAKKIVAHRDDHGPFESRTALLDVAGIGPRTYQQAAGFLRVRGGKHPLDVSAVHPERYAVVERMASDLGVEVGTLVGNAKAVAAVVPEKYFAAEVGSFTINDILDELKRPGRDPRASFEPPAFRADVRTLEDLRVGMELEGVVTNVTAFGAFVDVGVHQDGLVHVSRLSDRFVKDPGEVAKVGQRVKVHVIEVDLERKRIALSARKDDAARTEGPRPAPPSGSPGRGPGRGQGPKPTVSAAKFANNPFASLGKK
jgi:protein Tex